MIVIRVILHYLGIFMITFCGSLILWYCFKAFFKGKPKYKVGEFLTLYGIPLEIKEVKYSKTKGWYYEFFHKEKYFFTETEIEKLIKK